MRQLLSFFLTTGSFLHGISAVAISPASTTASVHSTLLRREDNVPTLFLGDVAQYTQEGGALRATAAERSAVIYPTCIHSVITDNGIVVVFGPDLQQDMSNIINEKCKNSDMLDDCRADISKVLSDSSLRAHTKRFVLAAAVVGEILREAVTAVVVALGAVAVTKGLQNSAPEIVNFPNSHSNNDVLDQIYAMPDASLVAVATSAEDKIMATITVNPTPATPTPNPQDAVQIEEVTEDNGDHKKGDILIHIPEATAQRLVDFLGMMGLDRVREVCRTAQAGKRHISGLQKRVPPTDELTDECQEELARMAGYTLQAENDELLALVPAKLDNPMNLARHPNGVPAYLTRQLLGIHRSAPAELAHNVNSIVYFYGVAEEDAEQVVQTIFLAVDIVVLLTPQEIECASDLVCLDKACDGTAVVKPYLGTIESEERFQTGQCTVKETKGCRCERVIEGYALTKRKGYLTDLQTWVQDLDDDTRHPDCNSDDKIDLDPKLFEESINAACRDHNELRRLKSRDLARGKSWDWSTDDTTNKLDWYFHWEDRGEQCQSTCQDVYKRIKEDEKCVWDGGMSKEGSVPTDCGTASYSVEKIEDPPPPPPPPQLPENWDQYIMYITQRVFLPPYRGSKVEWELVADPWKAQVRVEGPATYTDVHNALFPIRIIVDDAEYKETTKIRFQIANPSDGQYVEAPWWQGSKAEDRSKPIFGATICQVTEDWKEDTGAWQREIRCAFPKLFEAAIWTGE